MKLCWFFNFFFNRVTNIVSGLGCGSIVRKSDCRVCFQLWVTWSTDWNLRLGRFDWTAKKSQKTNGDEKRVIFAGDGRQINLFYDTFCNEFAQIYPRNISVLFVLQISLRFIEVSDITSSMWKLNVEHQSFLSWENFTGNQFRTREFF